MAARCWETKRHREDTEPCSRSLEMWDKGFASRKYAGTLQRFCQMLIKHVYSRAHQHNCGLSARRPNSSNVSPWIRLYRNILHYKSISKLFFFFYWLLPKLRIQIMYKIRHCLDTVQFKIDKLLSEKNRLTHPSLRPLIKKGKTFRRKKKSEKTYL